MKTLENKIAIVTGAGHPKGIGRSIAVKLAEQGASVVVTEPVWNAGGASRRGSTPPVSAAANAVGTTSDPAISVRIRVAPSGAVV